MACFVGQMWCIGGCLFYCGRLRTSKLSLSYNRIGARGVMALAKMLAVNKPWITSYVPENDRGRLVAGILPRGRFFSAATESVTPVLQGLQGCSRPHADLCLLRNDGKANSLFAAVPLWGPRFGAARSRTQLHKRCGRCGVCERTCDQPHTYYGLLHAYLAV